MKARQLAGFFGFLLRHSARASSSSGFNSSPEKLAVHVSFMRAVVVSRLLQAGRKLTGNLRGEADGPVRTALWIFRVVVARAGHILAARMAAARDLASMAR